MTKLNDSEQFFEEFRKLTIKAKGRSNNAFLTNNEGISEELFILLKGNKKWEADEFNLFIRQLKGKYLSDMSLIMTGEALEKPQNTDDGIVKSTDIYLYHLKSLLLEKTIVNKLTVNTGNKYLENDKFNYHMFLTELSKKYDVDNCLIEQSSTSDIEKLIFERFFTEIWDNRLTELNKKEIISKLKIAPPNSDLSSLVPLTAAALLSSLSATIVFSGFAFYTTMSSIIFLAGELIGVTFPFIFYSTASTIFSIVGGPVGWAIGGLLLLIGLGKKSEKQVLQMDACVAQIFCLKLKILEDYESQKKLNINIKDSK